MAASIKATLERLGYGVVESTAKRPLTDAWGRRWRYKTFPIAGGGGPTNYFATAEQLRVYAARVEQVRGWQAEPMSEGG